MTWEKKAKEVRELLNKDCKTLDAYIEEEKDKLHILMERRKILKARKIEIQTKIKTDLEYIDVVNKIITPRHETLTEYDIEDLSLEIDYKKLRTVEDRRVFTENQLNIPLSLEQYSLLEKAMLIEPHRKMQGDYMKQLKTAEKEIEEKIEFIAHSKGISELQECERKED